MTEVAATEDVRMSEVSAVADVSKVASEGDVAMMDGDGDDHEKMVKAAKQSEFVLFPVYSSDTNFVLKLNSTLRIRTFHMTSERHAEFILSQPIFPPFVADSCGPSIPRIQNTGSPFRPFLHSKGCESLKRWVMRG